MDLRDFHRPVPRYTSYPTAPQFRAIDESVARMRYQSLAASDISLYIHIPFCKTMCLFCGCSVILNRKPERQEGYFGDLLQEIECVGSLLGPKRVTQLHLGGGTPTSLTEEQFDRLMAALRDKFTLEGELSIEVDPRTVAADKGRKLAHLRALGFNRVSFGVQDLDPDVQEAIRRYQSEEMTVETLQRAKELGFSGLNVDLIYGLPRQTRERFARTIRRIGELNPDRVALFSLAYVPWLKGHQRALKEEELPSFEEKFALYMLAREELLRAGYEAIGMDHFCLPHDSLMQGFREGRLMRNFQGYSLKLAQDMIGLGVTAIGSVEGAYFQNVKSLDLYREALQQGRLPIAHGFVMSQEDHVRKWVIDELMCRFQVDPDAFETQFKVPFETYFANVLPKLEELRRKGLLEEGRVVRATELGSLLIRLIASQFDAYLEEGEGKYSRSI